MVDFYSQGCLRVSEQGNKMFVLLHDLQRAALEAKMAFLFDEGIRYFIVRFFIEDMGDEPSLHVHELEVEAVPLSECPAVDGWLGILKMEERKEVNETKILAEKKAELRQVFGIEDGACDELLEHTIHLDKLRLVEYLLGDSRGEENL